MRFKGIAAGVGLIMLITPLGLLLPTVTGLLYKEPLSDLFFSYLVPGAVTAAVAATFYIWGRKKASEMRPVEALVVVAISWILTAVVGALPFIIIGAIPGFVDALFESMSGFTTTGASVLTEIDGLPRSILLWRGLTQWLGGLGVVVLTVALLSTLLGGPKAGLWLMKGELPGHRNERVFPRIKDTAVILWGLYLGITLLEITILVILGLSLYDAVCHTFTTLSTGGFTPHTESIGYFSLRPTSLLIEIAFIFFMLVGSINFMLHYGLMKGEWRRYLRDPELKLYLFMVLAFVMIIAADLAFNGLYSPMNALRASAFQVTSIISTTGYATEDFGVWPSLSRFLLFAMMLVGGMTGSTAGAIKVARILIATKSLSRSIRYFARPRAHIPIRVGEVVIPERIVHGVGLFIFGYMGMFLAGTLVMTLTGLDTVTSLSAVATTMGGVGPGLNVVGPAANFASISGLGKLVLSALMWFGRLEILTCLILFFPSTYRS